MQYKNLEIARSGNLEIKTVLDQENTTYVEVKSLDLFDNVNIIGRGKARWNPIDRFDPEIGKQVALARALKKWARKSERFWIKAAISNGEYKTRLKREREVAQYADILWRMQDTNEKLARLEVNQNTSQQPKTGLEAVQKEEVVLTTTVEDLADIENRNKAKLLGDEKLTSANS